MLYLVQSNQLESLLAELCKIRAEPPNDILSPEEIIVQNTGMARWLSREIAAKTGIAANIRFPLPARFFWHFFAVQLEISAEEMTDYGREILHWRILKMLPSFAGKPEFAEIAEYLLDDADGRKSYHLAGMISGLYDQYLVYRPDMLLEWEKGKEQMWQAVLWRHLQREGQTHRAGLLGLLRRKHRSGAMAASSLPGRIFFFGISSLAPVYLEIISMLGSMTEVYLFHLNPCRQYWADLSSPAAMARQRAGWRRRGETDLSGYFDCGNPLLASLGRVGQEFALQLADMEAIEHERYVEPAGVTLLACLQRDILDLRDRTDPAAEKITVAEQDRSLEFHSCHSRQREIQVLHDRLLELFESDPALRPGDVLVMAPDIEAYSPAVRAVFDSSPRNMHIPWSLADRTLGRELPLAEAFTELLELLTGRCTAPEVTAFLEIPAVLRRFDIDQAGVAIIRRWIGESGVCWGLDREHRLRHGLEMSGRHSWGFGLDRLLFSWFSGEDGPLFHDIAACSPMSTADGMLLGRLADFIERLQQSGRQLQGSRRADEWGRLFLRMLDDFFRPDDSEDEQQSLSALREIFDSLMYNCRRAAFSEPVSFPVMREYCRQALASPSSGQAFLSGRVTFCNMVPMRSIPFAVICLLGMNDSEYPRSQFSASFDMMSATPRLGDRNRRSDDRYLFLESLISARKSLYISWLGRDQQDNSPRLPSIVVSELLDYVEQACSWSSGRDFSSLVAKHPLQPFSPRCFDGTPLASYAAAWYPGGRPPAPAVFVPGPLAAAEEEHTVELRQLSGFWSSPVRFFLQERLGIRLRREEEMLPENEPFLPDHLDRYRLVGRVVEDLLAGRDSEECCRRLEAAGDLPHGGFGTEVCRELLQAADDLAARVRPLTAGPREPLEVDLQLGGHRLTGWLEGVYQTGCVRYRPSRSKGRDLLRLWVEHLVLNCLAPPDCGLTSFHAASDTLACFHQVDGARDILAGLMSFYQQGLREPLHFFPETSLAWHTAVLDGKNAADRARSVWQGGFCRQGEGEDPAYLIGLRGRPPFTAGFEELAAAVYGPLVGSLEKIHAAV